MSVSSIGGIVPPVSHGVAPLRLNPARQDSR
jgi:hypothetical protein